jgi:phosphopantothenoylcysteine decarboxylase/phosphopantothenate--cysteine ligase
MSRIDNAQVFISAAAVADYTPTKRSPQKIKKKNENITIEMCRTEDILKRVGDKKGDRIIVGFAAETENLIENAEKKLMEKNLDLIVGNDISKPKEVFGSDTNKIILIPRKGQPIDLPKMSKREAADALLDYIAANLLKRRRQK